MPLKLNYANSMVYVHYMCGWMMIVLARCMMQLIIHQQILSYINFPVERSQLEFTIAFPSNYSAY